MSFEPRQLDFLSALMGLPQPVSPGFVEKPPHADILFPAREPAQKSVRQRRGARAFQTGHLAEEAALRLYTRLGACLLAQRYRVREGEIDLVFEMGGQIVFCEVKARRTLEEAAYAITPRQWQRLEQAANRYIVEHNVGADTPIRFDVILVDRAGAMEVVENAHLF